MVEQVSFVLGFIFATILFSPTFILSVFFYCPIHIITSLIYIHIRYDLTKTGVLKFQTILLIYQIAACLFLFYLVNHRALQTFFHQQASMKREQQMYHMFNSQSDAIAVVESIKKIDKIRAINDEE